MKTRSQLKWIGNATACAMLVALALASSGAAAPQGTAPASAPAASRVMEIRIQGMIHGVMAEYVLDGFTEAERIGADLVLITMDTPGGADPAMRDIISRIINSSIPVVVYVSPRGKRAASAGFFILLSADVAAMAPGTNTGAASPVFMGGGETDTENTKTLRRKVVADAAAYMRSIVGQRGRNVDLAEQAVTEARAFSEKEALENNLIDIVADSTDDLLKQLNGRAVKRFDGTTATLNLNNPSRTAHTMSRQQEFLARVAQPDILYILFLVGMLGIYVEFNNPGLVFPGVVGGLCLLLALVASQVLPVNLLALLFIAGAVVLFVLEAKYTSYGLLTIGGIAVMILGAMMLINSPITGLRVSLGAAFGATLPFAALTVFLMREVIKSFKWKPATGVEALVGAVGDVTEEIDGRGMVFVEGELWRASADSKVPKGARVRVVRVEGLNVHVEPTGGTPPEQ